VRAYWDGSKLLSRLGNVFHAPDWFIQGLPEHPLDGELFLDRKSFQKTVAIVRRQDKSDHWKKIKFLIFDAPAQGGCFEDRVKLIEALKKHPYAIAHPHVVCTGIDHLKEELSRIEALGGEGVMLRQPRSMYVAGRSSTLLKVKSFKDDEAVVIAHQAGAGRHKGRLGALVVRLPNGKEFSIGTGFSDKERETPPPVGSTVVFRYQELSDGGVPRFPSFHGVREDVLVA
jgi:DNA ligase-1